MSDQRDTHQFSAIHYQVAMEAAGIGMWDWDLLEDRQLWSEECKAILGAFPGTEEAYTSFLSLLHPEDRDQAQQQLDEALRNKTSHSIEYRVIWPDGSVHWIVDRGRFLSDEQGRTIRLTGVVIDITARKLAEEALLATNQELEQQQAFWQTLLRQAPSGIVVVEAPEGKVLSYNEEAVRIVGLSNLQCEDYTDYTRFAVMHLDGTPYQAEEYALARAIHTGEVVKREEMLYRRNDGRVIYVVASAAPIFDAHGSLLAAILILHDVSERYELERKKDEFICLASHELRTPLTSLKGNLQLLQRRLSRHLKDGRFCALSQEEEQALFGQLLTWSERALRQVRVEERLMNDLLDAASLQTEELRIVREMKDLGQVVREAVEDLQAAVPPGLLILETSVLPNLPVSVDEVRIGQVIARYVSNALLFATEQHPVTVGIVLEGSQACVWVRDAGPGLSPEQQQDIWKRFSPAPGRPGYNKGMTGGGLGLGLYICQRLIHLHGGTTGVDSTPGKGSRFWFLLPL